MNGRKARERRRNPKESGRQENEAYKGRRGRGMPRMFSRRPRGVKMIADPTPRPPKVRDDA